MGLIRVLRFNSNVSKKSGEEYCYPSISLIIIELSLRVPFAGEGSGKRDTN